MLVTVVIAYKTTLRHGLHFKVEIDDDDDDDDYIGLTP